MLIRSNKLSSSLLHWLAVSVVVAGCTGEIGGGSVPGGSGATDGAGPGTGAGAASSTSTATTATTGAGNAPGAGGSGTPGTVVQDGQFPPAPMVLDGKPLYTRFMRLTNAQWERAVQDILELDAPPDKARFFQTPVAGATDFVNNEAVLEVTNDLWAQYHLATKEVVQAFTASDAPLQRIYAGNNPREFIETFGRRAYRRPLTEEEVDRLEEIFTVGAGLSGTASSFTIGAGLVIEAMLQSPHFLYRTELGANGAPLSGYEIASKLSFLLRGTTPSDELLDAAGRGELDSSANVVERARQMLEEPDALEVFRDFHAELFEFQRYTDVTKDLPEFNPAITAELEEASVRFFERIFTEGLGVREVLTSTQGYVGPLLAELYGVQAPRTMTLMDLGPERAGYFSQVPFLMLYGDNEHADAIHRGVHLNYEVLCAEIPPPPAAISLPPATGGQTDRERVAAGTAPCGNGCHDAYINPLGFAFENFDGMGRLRTTDNGVPVDTSSSYPFADGTRSFANAPELMNIMATTEMAHACYAKYIAGYALQRDLAAADTELVAQLMSASLNQGSSMKQLLLDLIAHPAFLTRNGGPS